MADIRGGELLGQVGQEAPPSAPGLLDMASDQSAIPGWVMEEWNRTPEDMRGQLAQQYQPSNWMRTPPATPVQGDFTQSAPGIPEIGSTQTVHFGGGYRGIPQVIMDEWNRTPEDQRGQLAEQYKPANWARGAHGGQGNLPLGPAISPGRREYDINLGKNPDFGEGASNWSPLRPFGGFPQYTAVRHHGSANAYGIPGQLDPWMVLLNEAM